MYIYFFCYKSDDCHDASRVGAMTTVSDSNGRRSSIARANRTRRRGSMCVTLGDLDCFDEKEEPKNYKTDTKGGWGGEEEEKKSLIWAGRLSGNGISCLRKSVARLSL